MKNKMLLEAIGNAEEKYLEESERYRGKKGARIRLVAACLALILAAVPLMYFLFGEKNALPQDTLVFNALEAPERLSGDAEALLSFGGAAEETGATSPPRYYFDVDAFVVRAELEEILPGTYGKNKIMKFRTLEAVNGKNIPEEFYYMISGSLEGDFFAYDTFIISMRQKGTEGYVIENTAESRYDVLELPLFSGFSRTELGDFIAFTDGKFDERLWQDKSWVYGYQFAEMMLDAGSTELVVYRGCTEEYTLGKIRSMIASRGETSTDISAAGTDFTGAEAKAALEYVKPFENGVFLQKLIYSQHGVKSIKYTRYINNCETDEYIIINTEDETVSRSAQKYTEKDLEELENIALHIADMKERYSAEPPAPPHTNESGKLLHTLKIQGRYAKKDGVVYGIIEIYWTYGKKGSSHYDKYIRYYDDKFILYGNDTHIPEEVSREEFAALADFDEPVRRYEYGKEYYVLP